MIEVVRFEGVGRDAAGRDGAEPWTFSVAYGEAVGLVAGPSEADAVVHMCAGSAVPPSGSVEVLGLVPAALSRYPLMDLRRRTGIVLQREGLVSNLSLRDNLIVPLVFGGRRSGAEARRWADRALAGLDLEAYGALRPADLSREVRITAAVVRAALHGPELLVVESLLGGLPTARVRRLVAWCRERCGSILLLLPESTPALDGVVDRWVDPDGTADDPVNEGARRDG